MTSRQLDIIQEAFGFLGDNGNQYDFTFQDYDTFIVSVTFEGFSNGTLLCRIIGEEVEYAPSEDDFKPFSEEAFWKDMFYQLLGTHLLLLNESRTPTFESGLAL